MWFLDNGQYTREDPIPVELPYDKLSTVAVFPDGTTQPGWGKDNFMESYLEAKFLPASSLKRYYDNERPFAFIMRSIPGICVDIDGKNGGIETSRVLQLPPTLAERSRSGNGYHLFYRLEETWDEDYGYCSFSDINGLIPGVDIRGTGLVFHFPNQRWNNLVMEQVPASLEMLLTANQISKNRRTAVSRIEYTDEEDIAILQHGILEKLKRPIEKGDRNNKLFSLGAQLRDSGFEGWDIRISERGRELGLPDGEINGIIRNIERYT